jgi:capsular polysaccharide transport system permease protein
VWGHENVERVVHPFTYLMIPFTGAFFMVWWLPTEMQYYALLNPSVHMFEIIRDGQFGPGVPYHWDLGYMVACTVVLNLLGMLALRAVKGRLASEH